MNGGIVEDDEKLREAISVYLANRGIVVSQYTGYQDIVKNYKKETQILIIDIKLGDGDGLNLLSWLKEKDIAVKTVVITGYDSLPKRLESFTEGADDYMRKPVFPSELYLRLQRLCKSEVVENFQIDLAKFTKQEESLLRLLLLAKGSFVGKEYLIEQLKITPISLYTLISRVKSKSRNGYIIKSGYGRGWSITVLRSN
ncbi:response regulator transcription factor [bacterium]|nr:response regulator transcription factor [bacterium]